MSTRRLITLILVSVAVAAGVFFGTVRYWHRDRFVDTSKLISALQRFADDAKAAGRSLPAQIPLDDLLRGGYLSPSDVRAFKGMKVTFFSTADEKYPQSIVAETRLPDGTGSMVLGDGSVQSIRR